MTLFLGECLQRRMGSAWYHYLQTNGVSGLHEGEIRGVVGVAKFRGGRVKCKGG